MHNLWKLGFRAGVLLTAFYACNVSADIIVTAGGTAAPSSTLGPYGMTPFPADSQPLGVVSDVAAPGGGSVGFSPSLNHDLIGDGWATWSNGYTGDVYDTGDGSSVVLSMPIDTDAFYLYAEPRGPGTFLLTVTAQDGTSASAHVVGDSGAKYFGFYGTVGDTIDNITVSASASAGGFAVGEFGISSGASPVPEPSTLALLGIGAISLLAYAWRKRRRTA